jgi:hypothetical protein
MPVEIKKMYQEWKANMVATEGRAAFAIRQNRKYGTPTQFTAAAVPITAVHFMDVTPAVMPNGEPGLLCRLSNASPPTKNFPATLLVGGQGKTQVLTKWLNVEPTEEGRGTSFSWGDELLPIFIEMATMLPAYEATEAALPNVMGTLPGLSLLDAVRQAATAGAEIPTPSAGEVTSTEGTIVVGEAEFPIVPGTRATVSVGQTVQIGDSILQLDVEALANLTEDQLADLAACLNLTTATSPAMYIGKMPLYRAEGSLPKGELHFDVVDLVAADGRAVVQIVPSGQILSTSAVRVDLRPHAVSWPRQRDFVPATPRDRQRAESRQRTRKLEDLGEKGALLHLIAEAQAMAVKDLDLKLDHALSGPFTTNAEMAKTVAEFKLRARFGDLARLSPADKSITINAFLGELVEDEPTTEEAS